MNLESTKGGLKMTPFEEMLIDSSIKKKAIAERMGMSRSNFYKKQKRPRETFSADELLELSKIIGVPIKTVFNAVLKSTQS